MLSRLASLAVHRRRLVLILSTVGFILITAVSGPVMNVLSAGGYTDPDAESSVASDILEDRFDTGEPDFILLVTPRQGTVDDPETARVGRELTEELRDQDGVASVTSYWSGRRSADLRAEDRKAALVLARLSGDDTRAEKTAKKIAPKLTGERDGVRVVSGGGTEANRQASERVEKDLLRAEGVAVPITLVLLVLVFGSGMAALLPLAVAGVSIVGSLALLTVIAQFAPVSVFATNLTTALGLGLAIDYSLFIVSRYREERGKGRDNATALRISMTTAGRTVLFSSLTVLLSLAALLVFPLYYLTSFAYAGIGVVLFAVLGALVVLPALLALIGDRIDKFDLGAALRRRRKPKATEDGFWHRLATGVMRRPWPVLTVVLLALAVLVAPFTQASYGLPDDRSMAKDADAAVVGQALREDFPSLAGAGLDIVLDGRLPDDRALSGYAQRVSRVAGIERVDTATGSFAEGRKVAPPVPGAEKAFTDGKGAWMSAKTETEPYSEAGEKMVADVRGISPPSGTDAKVAGLAAGYVDTMDALLAALPYALLIIGVLTFVLLFLFTGSVLIPVKAIVLNLLSLTATFGAMVFVFQDGHLRWLVGDFTVTGQIDVTTPILMFCIIFGLSMDYEVFLLSRIREEYDRTGDNTLAVAHGLESTGRLITAAAGLLALFFIALISAGFTPVKILGLGTALAILMDAAVIRGLLVPAFMRLAGRANWWAPAPLRTVYRKFGFHHEAPPEPATAQADAREPAQPAAR
ncbi:MMPL family transporter [Streptomyces albus]|uniref:MMPL family transporter n=1 Tax=Streptomyces albus TaxID=1888 RepID=UPI0024AE3B38|nr:MMPL family transporter [Streptomyces albus]MDI6411233.1 MMPL family transporter [Streptomyces albus]